VVASSVLQVYEAAIAADPRRLAVSERGSAPTGYPGSDPRIDSGIG
jgi:hypothetical protein